MDARMRMRMRVRVLVVPFVSAVAGLFLSGCGSKGDGRTGESRAALQSMRDTRQEVARAKAEVNDASKALDKLSSGGNLSQAYKEYVAAVKEVEASGNRAAARAKAMRQNRRQYIAKWEQELDQISSPELKAGAATRRDAVKANFDAIAAAGRSARDAYDPFLRSLKEIQRVLANDLTPAGVEAIRPAMDKAKADAANLNERLDALIARLDEVYGSLAGTAGAGAK